MARKLGLSVEDVVAAAGRVADRDGLDRLRLSAVAGELGVRSPSLYAHVDGLEGLRRGLQLHAARRLRRAFEQGAAGRTGADGLRAIAHAYRAFARDHPGLFAALLPAPRPGEDGEVYEALAAPALLVAGLITGMGVAQRDAIPAVRALRAAVHGFLVLEQGRGFGMPEDVDASFEVALDVVLDGLAGLAARER